MTLDQVIAELNLLSEIASPVRINYRYKGGKLEWGKDLTPDQMERMKKGEVFILHDASGQPRWYIVKDGYGSFRQKEIDEDALVQLRGDCEQPQIVDAKDH